MKQKILATMLWTSLLHLSIFGISQADECFSCNDCCDSQWQFDAEYLYWQIQDSPKSITLVEELPENADPIVRLGGKKSDYDWRSGGRFGLTYWTDECHCWGAEVNYFFLPSESKRKGVSADPETALPTLASPFYNVFTDAEDHYFISDASDELPYTGAALVKTSNSMQGAELNGLMSIYNQCDLSMNLIVGFRYWNFEDKLVFETTSPYLSVAEDIWQTKDKFRALNNFYGGQIGLGIRYNYCDFFVDLKGKVALGAMCTKARINGEFQTNEYKNYETLETFEGGIFALPTNIGSHSKTKFSVLPEASIKLGYNVTECVAVTVGYNFLYASNVLWATKTMSHRLNPTQSVAIQDDPLATLDGAPEPRAKNKTEGLWVQGVTAGLEIKF